MPPAGRLNVKVLCGRRLRDTTYIIGSQNPYVVLKLGQQVKRSDPHEDGGINPVWNFDTPFSVSSGIMRTPYAV